MISCVVLVVQTGGQVRPGMARFRTDSYVTGSSLAWDITIKRWFMWEKDFRMDFNCSELFFNGFMNVL